MKKILVNLAAVGALLTIVSACATTAGGPPATAPNPSPVAGLVASSTTGPAPLTVTFDASTSTDNGSIINYFWDFGDNTSANGVTVTKTYSTGTFTAQLLVTDNNGAIGTASVVITATNLSPVANFTTNVTTGAAPLTVAFNASTSNDPDGSIALYNWNFGDNGTSTGQAVSRTFTPGVYAAKLTVTDNNGLTATKTVTITATGAPAAPTGLHGTGSGCCDTYGDFAWNPVIGADGYEVKLNGYFLGGCVTDHSAVINGQASSGRVQAVGLCLGSNYDVSIRARANGVWGPWSASISYTL